MSVQAIAVHVSALEVCQFVGEVQTTSTAKACTSTDGTARERARDARDYQACDGLGSDRK